MSVLELSEAKTHLNIEKLAHDAELQTMIDAAEAVIAHHCGPLVSTVTTVRVRGGGAALMLASTPVLSLTSVTEVDGEALTLSDLYLDEFVGMVTYNSGALFPGRFYDVVYNAGRATCPPDLLMAVKELLRHLWQTQRGPTQRPGSRPSEAVANTVPGAAYALPFRVSELIAPHRQFGIA